MLVVVSELKKGEKRIYHRQGCVYEHRIKDENRMVTNYRSAMNRKYCPCKYCDGLWGEFRVQKDAIAKWEKKYGMKITYHKHSDTLYLQTEIGCWKAYYEDDKLVLFHRNKYSSDMPYEEAILGDYHRQRDLKPTESMQRVVEYVAAHDKAKQIIAVDYRMLPKTTKKQKHYFRMAEKKAKRQEAKRLDSLFAMIEKDLYGTKEVVCMIG